MWDLVKRLVDSVLGPIWGRILKLPWLARLSLVIVILTVGGLFYYPEQVSYTFTPINVPFPGALGTTALGINDHGQIMGDYGGPGGGIFLYDNGVFTPFIREPDINGRSAFLYDKGVFTPIDASSPCAFSILPHGINAGGQIVGHCSDSSGTLHGFLYDKGVFTRIDTPFGAFSTEANGINAGGQIVGTYSAREGGFLYDNGVFTRIDVPFPGAFATAPNGINDQGQIVGDYLNRRGAVLSQSFLYDKGVFTPINVPGAIYTHATGINEHSQIVGDYSDSEGEKGRRPHNFLFLYDKGVFTPIDIPFPGADYRGVSGINARGQIVGYYYKESGTAPAQTHSFLATPHKRGWLWTSFIAVLLLAAIGFLVLWRARLGMSPAKAASGEPSVTEPSTWARATGRAEPPGYSARLVRQSPIATIPQELVFDREEVLLGSGVECDLILHHPSIAPQHARVTRHQQGYVLRAVHGTQSTLVNGRPIGENLLKEGWVVRLGEVEFLFSAAHDHLGGNVVRKKGERTGLLAGQFREVIRKLRAGTSRVYLSLVQQGLPSVANLQEQVLGQLLSGRSKGFRRPGHVQRGQIIVLLIASLAILRPLVTIIGQIAVGPSHTYLGHTISLVLYIALVRYLWRGQVWAQWTLVVLSGLGGLYGVFSVLFSHGTLSPVTVSIRSVSSICDLAVSVLLVLSPDVDVFLTLQRGSIAKEIGS